VGIAVVGAAVDINRLRSVDHQTGTGNSETPLTRRSEFITAPQIFTQSQHISFLRAKPAPLL